MQFRTVVALTAGLLAWGAVAAPGQETATRPKAVVREAVKDVGDVNRGQRITHEFIVGNEGSSPLQITEVKPSCGCTVADYDRTIAPGATGSIRASLDTGSFKGAIAKSVKVFTNDPVNPQLQLVIKANIRSQVEVDPGYVRFIAVHGEPQKTSVQTIWSEEKPDMLVRGVQSPYPFVRAAVREAGEEERRQGVAGRQWQVEVKLDKDAPVGPMADFLLVTTDHPELKTVRIPLSGFVRPVLSVTPRIADFGRRELDEPQTASLEIRNLSSAAVQLGEVSVDLEGLEAEIEPLEAGRLYKVLLTLKPGLPKGGFEGLLTIATSSDKQPSIEVSVKGVVL